MQKIDYWGRGLDQTRFYIQCCGCIEHSGSGSKLKKSLNISYELHHPTCLTKINADLMIFTNFFHIIQKLIFNRTDRKKNEILMALHT